MSTLILMRRVLRVLLMMVLLGFQVGTVLVSSEVLCQEGSGCCPPEGACNVNCVACACCPGHSSSITSFAIMLESIDVPPVPTNSAASSAVLPLFSTDILHVPKSV